MRTIPTINLGDLSLPPVIEPIDYEVLLADVVAEFKTRWAALRLLKPDLPDYDVELLESDPAKILLESGVYVFMLMLGRVNDAARALMLATATGGDLDAFATDFGLSRLVITPATGDSPAVMETDRAFRLRRQLAADAYAAAGPADAYRFFALSADPSIKEAEAIKGDDNRVTLVLLSRNGTGAVPQEIVSKVHDTLSPFKVRPMTAALYTRSADIVEQAVHLVLTVPPGPDKQAVKAKALAQVRAYVDERHAIGAVLRVDGLIGAARAGNSIETMQVLAPEEDVDPGQFGAVYVNPIVIEVIE